ncbi:MAG: DNA polymerase III subunit delta' [Alphaproteobacteria bacterium]
MAEAESDASPRLTADLIGHGDAEAALLQAWAGGRPHHAWLVTGPQGIGKATLAYRFARFMLLHGEHKGGAVPASLAVAADAPLFRRVASGGHSDLLTLERGVDAKGKPRPVIPVEDVRRVADFLHRTALEGGWRIVVVDSADDLNRHGANALLKILEEPPRRAMLLLVCHSPGRLPATILSRCRRLTLRALDPDLAERVVAAHAPGLAPADARLLARIADGRPGYALQLGGRGGIALLRDLVGLCETLPDLDLARTHDLADRFGGPAGQEAFAVFRGLFLWWLARVIRLGASHAPSHAAEHLDLVPGEAALIARLGAAARLDRWLDLWEKTGRLFDRGEAVNLDRRQVVLDALLALRTVVRPARAAASR